MSKIEVVNGVNNLYPSTESCVKGYQVIDVRGGDEFTGDLGHIKGAKLVTLGEELHQFLERAPKEDSYLFVCKAGGRSTQASLLALSKGFKNVTNLFGGMIHWNELALKTER